jgi:hypothetical protein
MGLSQDALRSVLEAGQEAGSAIANELIIGGSEAITGPNGINQMLDSLNSFADRLGVLSADMFYGAGVKQGEAMLKGIEDAVSGAKSKLKNPNLKLADVKGIGANFQNQVGAIMLGPSPAASSTLDASARKSIAQERGGVMAGSVTVNVQGADPQQVVNALERYVRQNGALPDALL